MVGVIRKININKIVNYYENPRHEIAQDEKDTLKKLFESVGNQYMLNLAKDIMENGLLGNQQIVVVYNDKIKKYVVYEGNRRIAAMKLLLNPNYFDFLDKPSLDKARTISKQLQKKINQVSCYVTNEDDAFFIMERSHSGEDKGRGVKSWNSREKDIFKARRSEKKTLSYLVDFYIRKYFNDFDITTIIPFTTIQRIFGNRKIKSKIGLDISNDNTFTKDRMQLIIDISKKISADANTKGIPMTRLYNLAAEIENNILPLIDSYKLENSNEDKVVEDKKTVDENEKENVDKVKENENEKKDNEDNSLSSDKSINLDEKKEVIGVSSKSKGGEKNLPYFFQGIDYSHLNPADSDSHGISQICEELKYFSDKQLVEKLPIAATFLVRSAIEQSIKYYSKKTYIQGQNKLIWEDIKTITNLSNIIKIYKRNLANYITDTKMRQYFKELFDDYEKNVDPLNWVVHRPADFQFDTKTLIEMPRKGLLSLINFFISN